MTRTKVEIVTEDGKFTLAQSQVPEYLGQWYLEVEVNTKGSYGAATLEGEDLLRLADLVRSVSS